jgi:hypothetical protein
VIAEANQQSTGSGMQYKGQVHYVIDDYPLSSSLSVSRDDKPVSPSTIDSLNVPQQNDGVQAYFTPVNF